MAENSNLSAFCARYSRRCQCTILTRQSGFRQLNICGFGARFDEVEHLGIPVYRRIQHSIGARKLAQNGGRVQRQFVHFEVECYRIPEIRRHRIALHRFQNHILTYVRIGLAVVSCSSSSVVVHNHNLTQHFRQTDLMNERLAYIASRSCHIENQSATGFSE